MIRTLGHMLGIAERARPNRPRLYFTEWDNPMITGIGWASELMKIAGGENIH